MGMEQQQPGHAVWAVRARVGRQVWDALLGSTMAWAKRCRQVGARWRGWAFMLLV